MTPRLGEGVVASRRAVIAGGAGAAMLAALGYRAWDRGVFSAGKGPAYEAWQEWRGHAGEDPARRPLHAAILAASAHNTQPWLFEPHEDLITVYADLSRNLGAADPFRRELCFSLGCALDTLWLAAFNQGYAASIDRVHGRLTPSPRAQIVKVADVTLKPVEEVFGPTIGEPFDPLRRLYRAIPRRHTNRGPYQSDKPLPKQFPLARLQSEPVLPVVAAVTDKEACRELGAMIVEATRRFIADPEMSRDSGRWNRTGKHEIDAHRDGVTVDTAGLSPVTTGLAKMLPDQDAASADQYWLASTKDVQVPTAPAFGICFLHDRMNIDELIDAGMIWQRHHLMMTDAGLATQPMNAPIEMTDRDFVLGRKNDYAKELRQIAGIPDDVVVNDPAFIFRLGYAERPALPSPRRPFEEVIRRTGFA
jgi:hypothetical protein